MESDADDPGNIFEEDEDNPERIAENIRKTEKSVSGTRVAPPTKRIIKNPRLKFNPERLCGERGIPVLLDHFKSVKFKGKGHEVEDLDKLMATLEHWTHRLFPSMTFKDCLQQIEKLGKKRQVQTTLRKIRLDMPVLDRDFVTNDDNEEDNVLRNDDPDTVLPPNDDPFDRLVAESQDMLISNFSASESTQSSFISSPAPNQSSGHILGTSFGSSLTDEQKERMARNRMLAAERRKAKLADSNISESVINLETSSQSSSSAFDASKSAKESASCSTDLSKAFDDIFKTSKLSTDNDVDTTEELGLDDLMDLVENDRSVLDKANDGKNVSDSVDESMQDTIDVQFSPKIDDREKSRSGSINDEEYLSNYNVNKSSEKTVSISIHKNVIEIAEETLEETLPVHISNPGLNSETSSCFKDTSEAQLEETVQVSISDEENSMLFDERKNKKIEVSEIAKEELMGLESMMDLVDEE